MQGALQPPPLHGQQQRGQPQCNAPGHSCAQTGQRHNHQSHGDHRTPCQGVGPVRSRHGAGHTQSDQGLGHHIGCVQRRAPRYGPHSGLRPCRHSYHHGLVAQGCRWHLVSHHIGCRQPRQGCAKHRAHHRTRIHPHRQAAQQQTRAGTAASPRNIFGAEMQHTLGSQQRKRRHSHVIVAEYQRHLPENAIAVSPPLQMPHACSGLRKRPHLHRHHGWPTAAKGCQGTAIKSRWQ